jgi:hypothetical protein
MWTGFIIQKIGDCGLLGSIKGREFLSPRATVSFWRITQFHKVTYWSLTVIPKHTPLLFHVVASNWEEYIVLIISYVYHMCILLLVADRALPANRVCGLHDLPWEATLSDKFCNGRILIVIVTVSCTCCCILSLRNCYQHFINAYILLLLYMIYFNIVMIKSGTFLWCFIRPFCKILTGYLFYFNWIENITV